MRTIKELVDNNTGFGFFGTAASKLGYRQAYIAYNVAFEMIKGSIPQVEYRHTFLASKAGRWWADSLAWTPDYGIELEAFKAVAVALADSKLNVAKEAKREGII